MRLVLVITIIVALNYFAACCGCYEQENIVMNNNQPPAPPAGHMNTNVLPQPPAPHAPAFDAPKSTETKATGKATITHLSVRGHGWIAVDKDTLAGVQEDQIIQNDQIVTFMSEGKMIKFLGTEILGTKTRFGG